MEKEGSILVLIRHGQSMWNKRNLFTGWVDVPLSEKGVAEALAAGERVNQIPFDVVYMSALVRAQMTAMLLLSVHSEGKTPVVVSESKGSDIHDASVKHSITPVITSKKLNERMYGKLQGMDKDVARAQFGKEQVHIWRRSFDVAPPDGESLEMTKERVLPYFNTEIVPRVQKGENVLVSAHGNSLRSIVMQLDNLSSEEVVKLEIATGDPLCYQYEDGTWVKMEVNEVQEAYKA